jgi:hypothetical protein
MPVLFIGFANDRIAGADQLWLLAARLHPALAFNDQEQLTASVGVPVIADARLETHKRGSRCKWR